MRKSLDLAIPFLILLCFLLPLRNGFTDDGFIHIQYANNIIERGEYSFNPGEISFGTTSPLWVMVLASLGTITGGGESLISISRFLSWISGFAAVLVLYLLVLALGAKRWTAVLAASTFAADVWFVRWTALSMETSAAVLAVLLMILASLRAWSNSRSAAFLGLTMVLASLVRPEVYLAFPVFLVSLWFQRRTADRRCVWITLAVAAALLVPWLLFAKFHIGSFLPNTAGAKSGGLVLNPVTFVRKFIPVVLIVGGTQAIAVIATAVSLLVFRGRSRLLKPETRFFLLWIVALPVSYVLFDIQILSRYMLLVTPLVCVTGWLALEELTERYLPRIRWSAVKTAIAVVIILLNAALYTKVVLPPSVAFSQDLMHNMKSIADYLRDNSEKDAVVAAADIGYLAFYSERRVLDLGGLVEPATGALRLSNSYEEIIQRGLYLDLEEYPHVDFFIDRDLKQNRFEGRLMGGYRYERVYQTTVRNLGIRKPGPYYYTLYRLVPQP
jgi:hypothetical protein